jgi:hypothetical protein
MTQGLWEGWIEFTPLHGGPPIRSPRETTQPNLADAAYWATGLTSIYLEGALERALNPPVRRVSGQAHALFNSPARERTVSETRPPVGATAVLDPFSVYEKGDGLLRSQLGALSAWHLVNIITTYALSDEPVETLQRLSASTLADLIVEKVAERMGGRADSR